MNVKRSVFTMARLSSVIVAASLWMSLPGGAAEPSMTYTEANWKAFVESHKGNPLMKLEALCRTDKGRAVEMLRIDSRRRGYGSYPILLTARHDARDAVANYVLEGILETLLGDSEDAKWLRARSEIVAIPFVDKDGVEDGTPGMDYACDYGAESKLASVEAIKKFMKTTWAEYYPTSIIDLHASEPQSKVKGAALVGGPGLWNWQQTLRFAGTLKGLGNVLGCETVENAKMDSSSLTPLSNALQPSGAGGTAPSQRQGNIESGGTAATQSVEFRDWLTQMTSVRFAARLEVSLGITPDLARTFGRDLVKALRRDLQGDASVFTNAFSERANMKYKISLPKGYDKDPAKKWPMILWLHGAGPIYNYEDVTALGVPRYVLDQPDCPFITLTPLLAVTAWSACAETLDILLQETMARYRVDAQRVYMTGQSAGANGTWDMAMCHPERFAAIAPVSHYTVQPPETCRNLSGLPIWVIYGDQDKMVPLQPLQKIVDTIRGVGIPVRFSILPGVTHDTFRDAFLKPELYDWFLLHTNPGIKPIKSDIKGVSLVTVLRMRVASCKRSVGWATLQRFVTENQISNPRYFWSRERGALYVTIGDASVKETDTIKITEIFGGKHAMRELPPTSRSFWEAYVDVVDVYRWMTLHDLQFDAVHCYFETDGTSPNPPNTKVYIAVKENKK